MTKAVILAGGFGTRLMEETNIRPKPMVEIGGMPILWHIMKYYASFGVREFVICGGYKQESIKDFFFNYKFHLADVTFDLGRDSVTCHTPAADDWKVTVVNTGADTMTGGRLKRVRPYLGDAPFFMTYGDGLSDVDLDALQKQYKAAGKLVALTAVHSPPRFGELDIENGHITRFMEKLSQSARRINAGYMMIDPRVLDYVEGDHISFEQQPLQRVAAEGQLVAFEHDGFWQCMDNQRERQLLETLWASGKAPWKRW